MRRCIYRNFLTPQFVLREDGTKVRKRNSREICVKRSLTQIKKKWPKCAPSVNHSETTAKVDNSAIFSKASVVQSIKKNPENDVNESITKLTTKIETLLFDLNQRIVNVDAEIVRLKADSGIQNVQNCAALDDFVRLKQDFDKVLPMLLHFQTISQGINFDMVKNKISSQNCEVKVNLKSKECLVSGDDMSTAPASDEDEESQEEELVLTQDFVSLKDQVNEISESLQMHSECLKKLKCHDFSRLKNKVEELAQAQHGLKCQGLEILETLTTMKTQDLFSLQKEVQDLKTECCGLRTQHQNFDDKFEKTKEEVAGKFSDLRNNLEMRISQSTRASLSSSHKSSEQFIDSKNLQKSDNEKLSRAATDCSECSQRKSFEDFENYSSCDEYNCCPKCSNQSVQILPSSYRKCFENSFRPKCSMPANCASYQNYMNQGNAPEKSFVNCSDPPRFPTTPKCGWEGMNQPCQGCHGANESENLDIIQKQVSSHSYCLQQLIRDIAMKLDRCEFEKCRRQLSEAIDMVVEMRREQACPPSAAGCTVPMIRNVNCISCQTTTNMKILAEPPLPRVPLMKYGRVGSDSTYCSLRSRCQNMSNRNWACYSPKNGRRAGGSHTKLPKIMEVREMRFKRLKTPIKLVSSIMIYKNRFRKKCFQI